MFQLKLCYSIVLMLMLIQTVLSFTIDISNTAKECQDSQSCSLNINKNLLELLTLLCENNKVTHVRPNPSNLRPVTSNEKFKKILIELLKQEVVIYKHDIVMPQQNSGDINALLIKLVTEMYKYELDEVRQNINNSNSQLRQLLLQLLIQQYQQLNVARSQGADAVATNQQLIALLMKLLMRPGSTVTVNNQNPVELPQQELLNIQPGRPTVSPAGANKKLVPVVVDLVQDELDLVEDKLRDVTSTLI